MRTSRVRAGVVACAAATAVALTGCASGGAPGHGVGAGSSVSATATATAPGTAALSGPDILKRAREAGAAASSFTMTFSFDPNRYGRVQAALSGRLSWDRGGHCVGEVTLAGHGSAELVASGTTMWVRPDAAFATAEFGPAAAATLSGKYLKGPVNDPRFADLTGDTPGDDSSDLCRWGAFELSIPDEGDENAQKLGPTTVGGVHVVAVQTVGKGSYTAYIATEGTPYAIRLGDRPGLSFTDYGRPVAFRVPPAAQTFDLSRVPRS
ncbi:hypothetical protein [Streptacidiphilus rugosus]|uniref:hypothetical protein n=1 Tax=Streptacidiphilus rugosus TaxID=405783 RepID=UPI000560D23B|nr:hypothetical protein [Streptacidiphilus rugosus]